MSAEDVLTAVHRRDLSDIEVGAGVVSKSYFVERGLAKFGIVIDNTPEGDPVPVVRIVHGHPVIEAWDPADIDETNIDLHAASARQTASTIHAWIGRQRRMQPVDRANWSSVAAALDETGTTGLYLPRAAGRYAAAMQARRSAS